LPVPLPPPQCDDLPTSLNRFPPPSDPPPFPLPFQPFSLFSHTVNALSSLFLRPPLNFSARHGRSLSLRFSYIFLIESNDPSSRLVFTQSLPSFSGTSSIGTYEHPWIWNGSLQLPPSLQIKSRLPPFSISFPDFAQTQSRRDGRTVLTIQRRHFFPLTLPSQPFFLHPAKDELLPFSPSLFPHRA